MKLRSKLLKRAIDLLGAGAGTVTLLPIEAGLILATVIFHGRPIFFVQERPGKDGKIFKMYKFRTMKDAYDANGQPLPDVERLTSFGRFLRATSLDELPELINVLKGNMSLVGPRPLLIEYLPRYNAHQARRHDVKPGITGWAQINGRNALSWEQKFDLDVWYVDNWSIGLDMKILLKTLKKVLAREGISAANEATMPRFMGNQETD